MDGYFRVFRYLIELMAELHKLDSLIALNANCRRLSSLSICQDASDCSQKSLECPNLAITHARDILYREILAVEKRLSEKIRTRNVSKRSVS